MTLTSEIMNSVQSSVQFARLLTSIRQYIRRYVVVSDHQATALALWVAHTYAFEAADCTPYISVGSATMQSGKTRLLEVLERIVRRPWMTGRVSAAALVRMTDAEQPTLLLDESDAAFKADKEYAEALRGILNTGYRQGGTSSICVGPTHAVKKFETFCPKAIAGIGNLPDTVADRSILIRLQRRKHDEPCERWRARDGEAQAVPLREALELWATATTVEALRVSRPALPDVLSDRAQDVWEPLFAIAERAGSDWAAKVRAAAVSLAGVFEDTDIAVELLRNIDEVLHPERYDLSDAGDSPSGDHVIDGRVAIPTQRLLTKLIERKDWPWATWKQDKPMTEHGLARMLKRFQVSPRSFRTFRGYPVDALEEAVARYVRLEASHCHAANGIGGELPDSKCHAPECGDTLKTATHHDKHSRCDAVTVRSGGEGKKDDDERYSDLPPEAVLLALDLEARHCHLEIDGHTLVVGPSELLTDTDRTAIRRWKPELLRLVQYCDGKVRETQGI